MFKNPFSFEGRIRRLEYGLSYLIFYAACFVLGVLEGLFENNDSGAMVGGLLRLTLLLASLWFLWAQGAKRCHDLGNSGWYQLIPFYGLWMLFSQSQHGANRYGMNPKNQGNDVEFGFEQYEHPQPGSPERKNADFL